MSRVIACVILFAATLATADALPPHPRLMLDSAGVARLKERVTHEPWKRQWERFLGGVERNLDDAIDLPPRGGNWSHNYVCPEHGARLTRGRWIGPWQWEHICPVGDHILKGDPSKPALDFDGSAMRDIHNGYAEEIRDMGLAYQVTGEKRYADRARELILAYSAKYLTYERHENEGKPITEDGSVSGGSRSSGGRVMSQPLSEATWLCSAVEGADLVWDTLSEADRKAFEEKLIRPALSESIINRSKTAVIHNIQNRRNSAVGLVGFLLGDQKLINEAIDGISGYRTQMKKGVQEDGFWFEGSWGYHFLTLESIWPLTEAARNCGIDLYGPQLKKMYDAPFGFATPALTLPPFNDSGEHRLARSPENFELAYARYSDPKYVSILASARRDSTMALLYGVDALPASRALPELPIHNSTASGMAIFQEGAGDEATWACMKYGPHGGGHGHFDKLNVVIWARGMFIGIDSGTRAYGSPIHKEWDKTSLAHNTLTIDEDSQEMSTGKCLAFGNENGVDFAMADAGPIYEDIRFIRTVAMLNKNLLVFIDQVRGDFPHTMDIAWHHRGQWVDLPAGEKWKPPKEPGYQHFRDATTRSSDRGIDLPVEVTSYWPQWRSRIVLAGGEPTQIITGTGIGSNKADQVPMVVFRRDETQRTTYVWAVSIDGSAVKLDAQTDSEAVKATVNVAAGDAKWRIDVDSERALVHVR